MPQLSSSIAVTTPPCNTPVAVSPTKTGRYGRLDQASPGAARSSFSPLLWP